MRNSRVPEIVRELESFGLQVVVYDPVVDPSHAKHEYDLTLCAREDLKNLDALILAVTHDEIINAIDSFLPDVLEGGVVVDIKSALDPASLPTGLTYWSL
ncbi:MAG: UDP binding domain-containing protein [Alphaproteobacteria bacterium]|nr:UDP binding domain-containing protein [Alphaproteobacteria bacterium]